MLQFYPNFGLHLLVFVSLRGRGPDVGSRLNEAVVLLMCTTYVTLAPCE